jgi:hypothetical protein
MDSLGKTVIPARYQHAHDFSEGLAAVEYGGKWGFIDKTGKFMVDPQYEVVYDFSEGLAAVRTGHKWGYIDPAGNMVIQPQYEHASNFSEGLASVRKSDQILSDLVRLNLTTHKFMLIKLASLPLPSHSTMGIISPRDWQPCGFKTIGAILIIWETSSSSHSLKALATLLTGWLQSA